MNDPEQDGVNDEDGLVEDLVHLVPTDREDLHHDRGEEHQAQRDQRVRVVAVHQVRHGQNHVWKKLNFEINLFSW